MRTSERVGFLRPPPTLRLCLVVGVALTFGVAHRPSAEAGQGASLNLLARIPLGPVKGRIDHLAVDLARKQVFVAELGNDSVGVVDLGEKKVITRLSGLPEPQGLGYDATTETLYVANAGDGSVRLFHGGSLAPAGRIDLGDDADNIRIANDYVYVGYGRGGIAIIDRRSKAKVASIPLKGHPESFQIDPLANKAYVNVPGRNEIAVVDLQSQQQVESWSTGAFRAAFPMALAPDRGEVIVVARKPAMVLRYAMDGRVAGTTATCDDADDVFSDARRNKIYVSCGAGFVQSFAGAAAQGELTPTAPGARTSLFVPELDRFFVAVPASPSHPVAELLVYGI